MSGSQFHGVRVAIGGIGHGVGFRLASPPRDKSEATLHIYMFAGPPGLLMELLEYCGSRS